MTEFKCDQCERDFSSQEGLEQHSRDKHGTGGAQSKHEMKHLKKQERETQQEQEKKMASRSKLIRRSAYIAVPVILIAAVSVFVLSQPQPTGSSTGTVSTSDIPDHPIHWHPKLTVTLDGQQQTIPSNLGIGAAHQPVHTHDATGTLHYEIDNPTPENMPLRYFFDKVWRKQFNSTCIMDYCNGDSGSVKMFVNGQENSEFENYIPKDKDEILVTFS